jgi:aminopeptidase-like protein
MLGEELHQFAKLLWPINRSITGDGVRQTLGHIKARLTNLKIHEVPTGTQVFDWTIPKEWRIREAWIITPSGEKICDLKVCNLHVVGYSVAVNETISLSELNKHLYSLPDNPEAIPYITSYYEERWGFCISQKKRDALVDGDYHVYIDSDLFNGNLTYGELIIPGATDEEVFLSTYVCHPSMANNELSGPVVTTFLAQWLNTLKDKRYTYRIVFIPETIGSITYLSFHKDHLKDKVIAGFNITCVGDERTYSYLPSRMGNTLSDRIAKHVLKHTHPAYKSYSWKDRGSDERQYCSPHIDLPIASIMRSKYGTFDEYHTSADDLTSVVTANGLSGGYEAIRQALMAIEYDQFPSVTVCGEPQLGKRGMYPTLSTKNNQSTTKLMMNVITWSDGAHSLLEIAELCETAIWDLYPIIFKLTELKLLVLTPNRNTF